MAGRLVNDEYDRGFWIHDTGTGQQVAQLHDRYMMMMNWKGFQRKRRSWLNPSPFPEFFLGD
jgi:putative SOS response-associated peptidase YedK